MKSKHITDEKRFELYTDDGVKVGLIEYKKDPKNRFYATHTKVLEGNQGKGYGKELVDILAAYAKDNGYKIIPVCPFVKDLFKKMPENYSAVLP